MRVSGACARAFIGVVLVVAGCSGAADEEPSDSAAPQSTRILNTDPVVAGDSSVIPGTAGSTQTTVPLPANDNEVTYLEAELAFWICAEDRRISTASRSEFVESGIDGVSDPVEHRELDECLVGSEFSQYVSRDGLVTYDEDFLNRANIVARYMKECLEGQGWPQDDLVFDEHGLLAPIGHGPTLTDSEVGEYREDSDVCHEEARQLVDQ